MNSNTNETPTGGKKEARLALAFGRAISELDDMSPEWLGCFYVDEQRAGIERVAKERGLDVVMFGIGYGTGGPGWRSVIDGLVRFAQEHDVHYLLVPTRRYLTGRKEDEPPYSWERVFAAIGVEIVESPPEDWL